MSEILFILTTVYVAYVFYNSINQPKSQTNSAPTVKKSNPINILTPNEIPPQAAEQPAETPTESTSVIDPDTIHNLRNPLTGEVSKIATNYPFTKRWIKEALVTEGLLTKIYSTHELNDEINAQIKQAINTLKTLSRYQA